MNDSKTEIYSKANENEASLEKIISKNERTNMIAETLTYVLKVNQYNTGVS